MDLSVSVGGSASQRLLAFLVRVDTKGRTMVVDEKGKILHLNGNMRTFLADHVGACAGQ